MGWRADLNPWVSSCLLFLICLAALEMEVACERYESLEDNEAIQRFREYLRIRTVQPEPDYASAVEFLLRQAEEIGLDVYTLELVEKKPIVVMTWNGSSPDLQSILLNSHMDVVPVVLDMWIHDPFAAVIDEDGNIYGRGTQDMKGMGMHYLEAIRNLKLEGYEPVRTIHVVFVPDEEIGGGDGWKLFVNTEEFASLNVGIAMDEGPINTNHSSFPFTWAEKSVWWLVIKATGPTGHGSLLFDGTAMENLYESLDSISRYRDSQLNMVKAGADLGEVVSVNGVFLKGGTETSTGFTMNIVPAEVSAGFDIRVPPNADVASALDRRIAEEWAPAHRNLTYWFEQKFETEDGQPPVTKIGESNPWWVLLRKAVEKNGQDLTPLICYASTDMRFLREKGVAAFGFSTIQDTPFLVHDHNELVNGWAWLRGIPVWEEILKEYTSFEDISTRGGRSDI